MSSKLHKSRAIVDSDDDSMSPKALSGSDSGSEGEIVTKKVDKKPGPASKTVRKESDSGSDSGSGSEEEVQAVSSAVNSALNVITGVKEIEYLTLQFYCLLSIVTEKATTEKIKAFIRVTHIGFSQKRKT
jgi:hypothetical protein